MESRRAETLEALSAYLQHQKTLLARTQADIERLKRLRADATAFPDHFVKRSNFQENNTSTSQLLRTEEKISDLQDYHPAQSFPDKIDWDVFSSCDATPLRTLAIRTRIDHTQRTIPSNTQRSPLSVLQKFVKDARKVILDPVFESLSASTDMVTFSNPMLTLNSHDNSSSNDHNHIPTLTLPPSLSEDENEEYKQALVAQESTTIIRKRERARTKTRDLKKRKIKTDLVVDCKLAEEGSNGVFVRHDIEDESAEVDVSRETPQSCLSTPLDGPLDQINDAADVDKTGVVTRELAMQDTKMPTRQPIVLRRDNTNRSSRPRRPSLKLQSQSLTALTELKNELSPPSILAMPSQTLGKRCRDVVAEIDDVARKPKIEPLAVSEVNAGTDKHRSETYKQAWSISEQHLLERLLEEIPDGERNRWAKISQSMGGRRTPRQVASRVQKYFEKLRRFGVGVDNKGKEKS